MLDSNAIDPRLHHLTKWLTPFASTYELDLATLQPACQDASFRRYFHIKSSKRPIIIMDAPPPQENCSVFVKVDSLLKEASVNVPVILEQDLQQGFLLLTDLGPETYYQRIQQGLADEKLQLLYRDVVDALIKLQHADATTLPVYDAASMRTEMDLFEQWYVNQHHNVELTQQDKESIYPILDQIANYCAQQAKVFVHRDFHSPNLIVCEQPIYGPNPGIIDFQDALYGPISYDLASLVMDARTTWSEEQQLDWAIRYWEKARRAGLPIANDFALFHQHYEIMGLQRNLRILGVFTRLAIRDHKPHYLNHIQRVNQYTRQVLQHFDQFKPLLRLIDRLDNIEHKAGYSF